MMGMPASLLIFCSCWVKLRRASSRHVRWGAKQAMAQMRISTPVWNCLPRMSHTPWFGIACCLVRPPYCSFGGGRMRPRTSIIVLLMERPNSCT
uniref:Putative secreted protein n=1 Tax=Ixodes ricinus TaxID=34613 RepID=A0A6B0U2U9_IXORI